MGFVPEEKAGLVGGPATAATLQNAASASAPAPLEKEWRRTEALSDSPEKLTEILAQAINGTPSQTPRREQNVPQSLAELASSNIPADQESCLTAQDGPRAVVANLQRLLITKLGADLGPQGADGIYGPRTEAALREFQRTQGLPGGTLTPETALALLLYDPDCPVKTLTLQAVLKGQIIDGRTGREGEWSPAETQNIDPAVKELQQLLLRRMGPGVGPKRCDGRYDSTTASALKAFRQSFALIPEYGGGIKWDLVRPLLSKDIEKMPKNPELRALCFAHDEAGKALSIKLEANSTLLSKEAVKELRLLLVHDYGFYAGTDKSDGKLSQEMIDAIARAANERKRWFDPFKVSPSAVTLTPALLTRIFVNRPTAFQGSPLLRALAEEEIEGAMADKGKKADSAPLVKEVQSVLINCFGFNLGPGGANGELGDETSAAIKTVRERLKLESGNKEPVDSKLASALVHQVQLTDRKEVIHPLLASISSERGAAPLSPAEPDTPFVRSALVQIQKLFNGLGFKLEETGVFDAKTQDIVRQFQKSRGLDSREPPVFDGKTLLAVLDCREEVQRLKSPELREILRGPGDGGERVLRFDPAETRRFRPWVKEFQELLAQKGIAHFTRADADGRFGPKTCAALQEFQRSYALSTSAFPELDRATLQRLVEPSRINLRRAPELAKIFHPEKEPVNPVDLPAAALDQLRMLLVEAKVKITDSSSCAPDIRHNTFRGLIEYQRTRGIYASGRLDSETLRLLAAGVPALNPDSPVITRFRDSRFFPELSEEQKCKTEYFITLHGPRDKVFEALLKSLQKEPFSKEQFLQVLDLLEKGINKEGLALLAATRVKRGGAWVCALLDRASDGKTCLDHLCGIENNTRGVPILWSFSQELACPEELNQGQHGTCGSTAVQWSVISEWPGEAARIMAGLSSKEGKIKFSSGKELQRVKDSTAQNFKDVRSRSERIMQAAFMDFGSANEHYSDLQDQRLKQGAAPTPGKADRGMTDTAIAGLMSAIYGKEYEVCRAPSAGGAAELGQWMKANCKPLSILCLRWCERSESERAAENPEQRYSHHAVNVVKVSLDEGYIYVRNPHGKQRSANGDKLKDPPREVYDAHQAIERFKIEDLLGRDLRVVREKEVSRLNSAITLLPFM